MKFWAIELERSSATASDSFVVGVGDDGTLVTVLTPMKGKVSAAVDPRGSRAGASSAAMRLLADKQNEGFAVAREAIVVELVTASGSTLVEAYRDAADRIPSDPPVSAKDLLRDALVNLSEPAPRKVAAARHRNAAIPVGDVELTLGGQVPYPRPNGQDYYPRKVGNFEDVAVVRQARKAGIPVVTYGAPGCGKTAMFEAAFPDLITVVGARSTEYADFVGRYLPDPLRPGAYVWFDGPLVRAADLGVPFLVDEIALIDPTEMSNALYPFMDGRGWIEVPERPDTAGGPRVEAKPGFFIVGAYNPYVPGARMSEALWSRFGLKIEYTTDHGLARSLKVPAQAVEFAIELDKLLRDPNHELDWAPQMRELLRFRDVATEFGMDFAVRALVSECPLEHRGLIEQMARTTFPNGEISSLVTTTAWS